MFIEYLAFDLLTLKLERHSSIFVIGDEEHDRIMRFYPLSKHAKYTPGINGLKWIAS